MRLKKLAIFIYLIGISCCVYGQKNNMSHKSGIVVYNKLFSKHFVVLLQDTTLSGNRFNLRFHLATNKNYTNVYTDYKLPAIILDSFLLVKSEERLLKNDSSVLFENYSKHKPSNKIRNIKKYIHLFIGYLDTAGQLNVVVQFVSPKDYRKDKNIYSKELFLLAQQKNLRFAIIRFKKEE
jgi:hypothetical protein